VRIESSIGIQRLLVDVNSSSIKFGAFAFGLSENDINGPVDAILKILKTIIFGVPTSDVLRMKIAQLINLYENRINEDRVACNSRSETYWSNFTQVRKEIEPRKKRLEVRDINIEGFLQALPWLDIYG